MRIKLTLKKNIYLMKIKCKTGILLVFFSSGAGVVLKYTKVVFTKIAYLLTTGFNYCSKSTISLNTHHFCF